jgi:hypothetical protein
MATIAERRGVPLCDLTGWAGITTEQLRRALLFARAAGVVKGVCKAGVTWLVPVEALPAFRAFLEQRGWWNGDPEPATT